MSLQHQNKSLPKHLQHARLQKEEDEEQWISGEELCTEGSSDEESKVNDFKKKLKGSAHSTASSIKSRIYSSSSASIKEKSDNNSDPASSKSVEWRPKRDDDENFYNIQAERLDMEKQWKSTLEELQLNKNLYKNSSTNLDEREMDTNKLMYDFQKNERNFDQLITRSEYITDSIVNLDKEIETFGSILEVRKHLKMDENPATKLTKEQSSRLEDLLAEKDDNENQTKNCFKHTNEQLENIAVINGRLKTLQEKSDDADLNGKTSEETVGVEDEGNREWKNYFKMKDEKLRKINNRLKFLQNLKSTENNKEPNINNGSNNSIDNNGNTEENQQ